MEAVFWLIAMVVFFLVEGATVLMVSLWFAVGALAAMIVSLCHGSVVLQAVVFLVVSVLCLIALRPLARKCFAPRTRTNVDGIIGTEGYVTEDIDNLSAKGAVKLGAMPWTARSTDGSRIPAGALVKVDRVEGVKVFVTVVKEKTLV